MALEARQHRCAACQGEARPAAPVALLRALYGPLTGASPSPRGLGPQAVVTATLLAGGDLGVPFGNRANTPRSLVPRYFATARQCGTICHDTQVATVDRSELTHSLEGAKTETPQISRDK